MPTPCATLTNLTVTGDLVTGPGMPTNLVNGLPTACIGDLVTGAACVGGAITVSTALTFIVKGRPAANIGAAVAGVTPVGVPMATAVAVSPHFNRIV